MRLSVVRQDQGHKQTFVAIPFFFKMVAQGTTTSDPSGGVTSIADERFDLLEKIALELAKANGAKLPPSSAS